MVKELAERTGLCKNNATYLIDKVAEIMAEGLDRDGSVYLRGIGMFTVVDTPEHEARNPQTGERIMVPARKHLRFRASKVIKARING